MAEIQTYTEAELLDGRLYSPGWRQPGSLSDILERPGSIQSFTPVLSVSVFREHPDDFTKVQSLTETRGKSTTHSDVVSTLTGAFPASAAWELVDERKGWLDGGYPTVTLGQSGPNPREMAVVARYTPNSDYIPDAHNLLPYLCHDIFSRKLGRPDLVSMFADDEPLGTVSLARIAIGVSYVGETEGEILDGAPLFERLLIFGAAAMLNEKYQHVFDREEHARLVTIPENERRYSNVGWTDNALTFPEDVSGKNLIKLAPYISEGQSIEFCAYGQCLNMTAEIVRGKDFYGHIGRVATSNGSRPQGLGLSFTEKRKRARLGWPDWL